MYLSVVSGRHACLGLEKLAEGGDVCEVQVVGYLADAAVGGTQQPSRLGKEQG